MDTLSAEQIARLPKYAQSYIAGLEQRLAYARKTVAELREGPADSNVCVRHIPGEPEHLLGRNTAIEFYLGDPAAKFMHHQGRITVHHAGPVLEVSSSAGALHVTPQASNVIRVRIGEF